MIEDDDLLPGEVRLPAADADAPAAVADTPSKKSRRVPANPDRPRISEDVERAIAHGDEKMAAAYEGIEDATAQLEAFTAALRDGHVRGELEASESLVHIISSHAGRARPAGADLGPDVAGQPAGGAEDTDDTDRK